MKKILVPDVDIRYQKNISTFLGSFDNKIELNNQMNDNLEKMALAIFKSWFINYDPVRDCMKSKDLYRMDQKIMTLFPDEFEDSELGKIPKGWKIEKLKNCIRFVKGRKPKQISEEPFENSSPRILIGNLDGEPSLFAETTNNIQINKNDIIMVMDGGSSGRLEIGFKGILGSTLAKIQVSKFSNFFIYHILTHHEQFIRENTTGTSIPHTDKNLVKNIKFVYPDNMALLDYYCQISNKIFEYIYLNRVQNKTIIKIRDLLLPKLISGQIRIKDPEKFLHDRGFNEATT